MKILLSHPGATWSTADVWRGLHDALQRANVEVIEYALDGRLSNASTWLEWCYEHNANKSDIQPPSYADKIYLASAGIIERGLNVRCRLGGCRGLWLAPSVCVANGAPGRLAHGDDYDGKPEPR